MHCNLHTRFISGGAPLPLSGVARAGGRDSSDLPQADGRGGSHPGPLLPAFFREERTLLWAAPEASSFSLVYFQPQIGFLDFPDTWPEAPTPPAVPQHRPT